MAGVALDTHHCRRCSAVESPAFAQGRLALRGGADAPKEARPDRAEGRPQCGPPHVVHPSGEARPYCVRKAMSGDTFVALSAGM